MHHEPNIRHYVIYIHTEDSSGRALYNHYGYWTGGSYQQRGATFPYLKRDLVESVRTYKSIKTASNACAIARERFDRIITVDVVGIDDATGRPVRIEPVQAHVRAPYGSRVHA